MHQFDQTKLDELKSFAEDLADAARHAIPHMVANGGGHLLNTLSLIHI